MDSVGVVAVSAILAMLIFREQLSKQRTIGLAVGLIAVALLNQVICHYFKASLTLRTMLKSKTCSGSTGCLGLIRAAASAIIWR